MLEIFFYFFLNAELLLKKCQNTAKILLENCQKTVRKLSELSLLI